MSRLLKITRALSINTTTQLFNRPLISSVFTKRGASTYYQHNQQQDDILQYRDKPESLSYFTGNFKYNDLLIELDALYKQFEDWKPETKKIDAELPSELAVVKATQNEITYSWKSKDKMSEHLSIPLTTSQWRKIMGHLNMLASLPKPLPPAVANILEPYQRFDATSQDVGNSKIRTLDDMGRAFAVGRRKESRANCYLVEGEGKILVNGVELNDYFQRLVDRNEVTLPLDVTETKDKYNAWILVKGGGSTGQAQAIKLGLGRALLIHNSELKPTLRKAGCITRDPRVVERKKEGQRKARAKYTWVKR